jgi:CheY-like chemotaxis protein
MRGQDGSPPHVLRAPRRPQRLELSSPTIAAEPARPASFCYTVSQMRVLVIDDNPDFLLLATRAFEAVGHVVETAPSAFGLVNKVAGASGDPPDVVLLDCDLPGLSGLAALELLARDRRTLQVPVVLVSAAESAAKRAAADAHARATFVKKDGHMRTLLEKAERHARSYADATVDDHVAARAR